MISKNNNIKMFNTDNTAFRKLFGIRDGKIYSYPRFIFLYIVAGLGTVVVVTTVMLLIVNPLIHLGIRMFTGFHK